MLWISIVRNECEKYKCLGNESYRYQCLEMNVKDINN